MVGVCVVGCEECIHGTCGMCGVCMVHVTRDTVCDEVCGYGRI